MNYDKFNTSAAHGCKMWLAGEHAAVKTSDFGWGVREKSPPLHGTGIRVRDGKLVIFISGYADVMAMKDEDGSIYLDKTDLYASIRDEGGNFLIGKCIYDLEFTGLMGGYFYGNTSRPWEDYTAPEFKPDTDLRELVPLNLEKWLDPSRDAAVNERLKDDEWYRPILYVSVTPIPFAREPEDMQEWFKDRTTRKTEAAAKKARELTDLNDEELKSVDDSMRSALEAAPGEQKDRLLAEVRVKLNSASRRGGQIRRLVKKYGLGPT